MTSSNAEQRNHLREVLRRIGLHTITIFALGNHVEMALVSRELGRHGFDRQHEIHGASGRRAPRHATHRLVIGLDLGLSKREAAVLLD